MGEVKVLPSVRGRSGWTAILPPRTATPRLASSIKADWAILGAGFTGLAAARALAAARPDDRIVVLDAIEVGEGASGRNSGFAIDHAHTLGGGAAAEESARAQKRLYSAAIDELRGLAEEHGIDCDWRDCGKFHAAASARGTEKYLKPLLAELDHIGEPYEWLDAEAMRAAVGTAHYHAGIYTPGTVLVNPAALVRGLADTLPGNVTLYENTPVTSIESGGIKLLKTPEGEVAATNLIVAANAFLPALGFAADRLMPFVAWASLSAPMTEDQQAALGGRPTWGITPANAFVAPTIQRTGDHRILYRETITYRPGVKFSDAELQRIAARHRRLFVERFPMLADLAIEHTWGGFLCMSRNQDSLYGPVADGIWAAAGFQGIGVTRGTIAGRLVAQLALGETGPLVDDMMQIAHPAANPPRPFLDVGVAMRTAWEAWVERDER